MTNNDNDQPTTKTFTFTSDEPFAAESLAAAFASRLDALKNDQTLLARSQKRALTAFLEQLTAQDRD